MSASRLLRQDKFQEPIHQNSQYCRCEDTEDNIHNLSDSTNSDLGNGFSAQREHHPLARVWEDAVANPNACEQDRPVKRARSAGRLDAVLGGEVTERILRARKTRLLF